MHYNYYSQNFIQENCPVYIFGIYLILFIKFCI